ncbi:MAG: nitric oxide reductase activation protein [Clostridiales bacterium]|nr:nitric oxide reductase activation protein [Clostridiales bacterium]
MEEHQIEIVNRMKNLIWTVCGDYTLDARPDVEGFLRSKYIALYDGIKQGAFAKYFDKETLSLYLVKKVYLQAEEGALLEVARLCMEEAVGKPISRERRGVDSIRKKAYEYVLEHDLERLNRHELGRLKIAFMRQALTGDDRMERKLQERIESIRELEDAKDTMEIIRKIDECYNAWVDPGFEKRAGNLETVLGVTLEELTEYNWRDFLTEEMYEENFEAYLEQMSQQMTSTDRRREEDSDPQKRGQRRVLRVTEEDLKKVYTYIELNFGKTYLNPLEEKKINYQLCRGIHGDCGLYFTDGILANPVKRNYQLEYAKKQRDKNKYAYYDNHRIVKRNIAILSGVLKKSIALRQEQSEIIADRGQLRPQRLWKIGRSRDARLFSRVMEQDSRDFVVDVLIDASGSQRVRQEKVALQAYIIMQALSSVKIPHRVMSFCTFWDHTILQRFREYDEEESANERIFSFTTSSNNRDGLAIKAVSQGLLAREEEQKILIILSDGRPYDVILNRPNARNPEPYYGEYAVRDTGTEIRRLRNLGVSVLGVFAGEEKDLDAEKKIFGKDFAYIRDISNFSAIVGNYLKKHLEEN